MAEFSRERERERKREILRTKAHEMRELEAIRIDFLVKGIPPSRI